ncbi:hypothetical protein DJ531_12305, partial [Sulfolobus sp. A20-N-F6]
AKAPKVKNLIFFIFVFLSKRKQILAFVLIKDKKNQNLINSNGFLNHWFKKQNNHFYKSRVFFIYLFTLDNF